MKTQKLIRKFSGDIYFRDIASLKQDYIRICETFSAEFSIKSNDVLNIKIIMEELFRVFSSNDLILMADYLNYNLMKKIEAMTGSE